MSKLSIFATLLLALPSLLLAQGNYVVNTANNSTTATYGTFNTFMGPGAGASSHVTGNRNTVAGYNSGISLTSGNENSFFGVDAGEFTTSGYGNTFVGRAAGLSNTTGSSNVFTGYQTGYMTTSGTNNVFSGYQAGYNTGLGGSNVFIGYQAGFGNSSGSYNVFMGNQAGGQNSSGATNVFIGAGAGIFNSTGNRNVFMGIGAGSKNKTGSNNIIIGPNSGTAITTSDDNVLVGYNSQAEDGLQNAIAIGANSRVAASNALILGNRANVGIGTSSPNSKLEIVSDEDDVSGLRLSQLTSQSKPSQATDQFLTVNDKGDVVKARYRLRINNINEWSDKVFAPAYNLKSLAEVKKYIDTNQHLPGIPSAEQVAKEGIDLVKMNATLLEKVEELTLYSIQLANENQTIKQQLQAKIDQLEKQHQQEMVDLKQLVNQLLNKQ